MAVNLTSSGVGGLTFSNYTHYGITSSATKTLNSLSILGLGSFTFYAAPRVTSVLKLPSAGTYLISGIANADANNSFTVLGPVNKSGNYNCLVFKSYSGGVTLINYYSEYYAVNQGGIYIRIS